LKASGRTIEQAGRDDLAALAPLFDAYRSFFAGKSEMAKSQAFLAERLRNGDSVIFIARNADESDGFIQLYPLWSSWYCKRIWFLSDLYVGEASRGAGVGSRLVQRAVEYARQTEASSIMVELPHREPHLAEFYAKLGFCRDDVFDLARYRLERRSSEVL
jgi:GNAT superfamily N-acetyltransferase